MKTYVKSIKNCWNGKTLTERDYNNLGDLMLIAIVLIVWIIL